ncbi:MAG: DUF6306 domain-containing protein, partial [Alphaproteobacteria bacterium]
MAAEREKRDRDMEDPAAGAVDRQGLERSAAGTALAEEDEGTGTFASPPCFMHEFEANYRVMSKADILALLNRLLEGERAGVQATVEMSAAAREPATRAALKDVAIDEARYCAMLMRHIARLGGPASRETGAFLGKIRSAEPGNARIALLNRGQAWVVRQIRKDLPAIVDEALRRDLAEMAAKHEKNVRLCE